MENDDLLQDFVVESNEHLEDIEAELLTLEAQGADLEIDLVNKVFRALHSIKGASGFLGLEGICKLSHSMENVLNSLRNNELVCSLEIVDPLLRSSDVLKGMLSDVASSNNVDIHDFVTALDAIHLGKLEAVHEVLADAEAADVAADVQAKAKPEPHKAPVASVEPSPEVPVKSKTKKAAPKGDAANTPPVQVSAPPSATVRVNVSVLDHLMNLAGELVLSRNQLLQTLTSDDRAGLDLVGSRIDQITSELQEAIMGTRMQPVGNVFGKFPRVVRDLSSQLDKKVVLSTKGDDVELDKTIIEAISDPLTHLVRNSVDHGVEMPAVRAANGKNPQGSILLHAFHDGGTVNITISDDGAGIDPEVLRQKAVDKGLITSERARDMSERDTLRLIFHPGFSTKEVVTDISGRGVGMDVVQTNLERLGGTIEIESELGVGTTLAIKLPLTLAIIPALIVKTSTDSFALPQLNILELVRVKEGDENTRIERLKGAEVLRLRNRLLPLVRLEQTLEEPGNDLIPMQKAQDADPDADKQSPNASEAVETLNIIVVAAGQMQYGLVVADLRDSEEIVVKPLGKHIKSAPCFSGATILGDGHIALILDVAGIANHKGLHVRISPEESERKAKEDAMATIHQDDRSQSVILFQNCPGEQFAIAAHAVSRIDRVKTSELVQVGGVEAVQGPDGILPVLRLENLIQCMPWEAANNAYVVVVDAGNREVGLLVATLIDIRSITTKVDTVTIRDIGVSGSVTLDGMETRVVDIYELADAAFPEWFSESLFAAPAELPGGMSYNDQHAQSGYEEYAPEVAAQVAVAEPPPAPIPIAVAPELPIPEYVAPVAEVVAAPPAAEPEVAEEPAAEAPVAKAPKAAAPAPAPVAAAPVVQSPQPPAPPANDGPEQRAVILVAEDSGFFRKKMITYLRESDYEVVQAEDGLIAWNTLESGKHNVRLVVTDVEMPNMTGLELAAAIRGSQKHSHLPVIALSSLATDEDIARAREVGVTDYQVKLDRNRLLGKIKELWNAPTTN